mgnify:FL=1|tara:strand:+ start:472 stop:975 length:504 start_codon:yes stop_codon:yes gene_type:complete
MDLYCLDKTTKELVVLTGCDRRPRRLTGADKDNEWDELKAEREATIKSDMVGRGHLEANLEVGWKTSAEIEVIKAESLGELFASDVESARVIRRKESKLDARKLLAEHFDPHTARKQDDGTEIPDDVRDYKTSMLQTHEDNKTKINTLGTKQEIREMEFVWPTPPNV